MQSEKQVEKKEELHVIVRYVAAEKPYDHEESRSETVAQLKAKVLEAFGLQDGQPGPAGSTVVYVLYFHHRPLENPVETLGALAGERENLELTLSKQIIQGMSDGGSRPIRIRPR